MKTARRWIVPALVAGVAGVVIGAAGLDAARTYAQAGQGQTWRPSMDDQPETKVVSLVASETVLFRGWSDGRVQAMDVREFMTTPAQQPLWAGWMDLPR